MLESIGGNDLRNLLAVYVRKLPIDLRTYLLPFIYGLLGGLAAVAFQKAASVIFSIFWERPSQQMPPGSFALFSLVTILTASIIAGLILTFVSRDAAGSGIPQAKVAFWRDFGFMPARVVVAKFLVGVISIGGGCSLGREGCRTSSGVQSTAETTPIGIVTLHDVLRLQHQLSDAASL
ncbi:MAG: chloride channel protein [Chthoniobacterales bacterium]